MATSSSLTVGEQQISLVDIDGAEYVSLTDMVNTYENGVDIIKNWIRSKSTIRFLGVREKLNNPNFNSVEFDRIRMKQNRISCIDTTDSYTIHSF